jgi:hypothetical protein
VLQVAGDGMWESAVALPVSSGPAASVAAVERVVAAAEHDAAIEVLWPGQLFVGVRWGVAEVDEAVAAAQRVHEALVGSVTNSAVSALVSLLGGVPECLPEFAELGAVNAWSSAQPLTLWRQGRPLELTTMVTEALSSRPDLTECSNPVALEIAAADPRPWWVGVVVSTAAGSAHRLDRGLLDDALVRGVSAVAARHDEG